MYSPDTPYFLRLINKKGDSCPLAYVQVAAKISIFFYFFTFYKFL